MADSARHPDVVDLAEYAEGLLDPARQQAVEDHVRDCAECSTVLTDLAGVPDVLARASIPPMPADVATRLDQAIAAESAARASEWSGAAARVTPIRRARRWLAPLAAAAAVIAVLAIAIPVFNGSNDATDDAGNDSSAADVGQSSPEDEAGGAPDERAPAAAAPSARVSVSRATFGEDVIESFYSGRQMSVLTHNPLAGEMDAQLYYESQLEGQCPASDGPAASYQEVVDIDLDGVPAYLLLNEPGRVFDAIAFTCDGDQANLMDSVSLR